MREILIILQELDLYGVSENVEIAKGRNAIPKSLKDLKQKVKRVHKWQQHKR